MMKDFWDTLRLQLMATFGIFSFSFGLAGFFYATENVELMFIPFISGILLLLDVFITVTSEVNDNAVA